MVEKPDYQKLEPDAFHDAIKRCHDSICSPSILKFEELLLIMTNHFLKNSLLITQFTKKNLRRNIEKCFRDELKFISFRGTLFLCPFFMSVEQVTKCLCLLNRAILNQKNLRSSQSWMSFKHACSELKEKMKSAAEVLDSDIL